MGQLVREQAPPWLTNGNLESREHEKVFFACVEQMGLNVFLLKNVILSFNRTLLGLHQYVQSRVEKRKILQEILQNKEEELVSVTLC